MSKLRTILLAKQIRDKEAELEALRARDAEFQTREADLAEAIESAETDEERSAVEESVTALETEQNEASEQRGRLEGELAELRTQLTEAEAAQAEAMNNNNREERSAAPAGASRQRGENRMNHMELRDADAFQKSGRHTYTDIRSLLRAAVTTGSGGVVGPTGVGGINDAIGGLSALVDMLKGTDCTGMTGYKVALMTGDAADAAAITEGSAPTESEPTFDSVTLTPTNYGTVGYVSKEIRKQSPLNYEEKVRESARRALRRKLNAVAANAILASTLNTAHALEADKSATKGSVLFDEKLLSNIILAYGGDEGVEGSACLYLNKADLLAFAAIRGKNEYLPVYSITPDAANPSTGIIKDNNGLSCRYCLSKDLTALSTATLTTTATKHMFYGNPQCAELALWGGFEVEVNEGYKFAEGLLTVRGEVTADVDVTVKNGFVVVTAKKAAA